MSKYRYNEYIQRIKPPSPSLNFNNKKMMEYIKSFDENSKVLDLGCGNRRLTEFTVNFDLEIASDIDVVGDAHQLPFTNNTFDFVICQAVLEHVKAPTTVVDEIYRILKKDGIIYVEVPFLQGFHADPHDYTRFTIRGIESLLCRFKSIESGTCVGPFSVLAWWLRKLPTVFFHNSLVTYIIEFLFGWLTFWVKYLDIMIIRFKNAHIIAGGLFFIGKKIDSIHI